MKLYFENGGERIDTVRLFCEELNLTLASENDADVIVTVEETAEDTVSLAFSGRRALLRYGGGKSRFCRALSYLAKGQAVSETPVFPHTGVMLDASRNAVMNVKTVKFMLRKMALMGLDELLLYTEDTYEVPTRPYFGYMRGRYTQEELRELDAYALALGIELVPCIQTLGHLKTYLRWGEAAAYKDTANVLLAGEEATYRFIGELLDTVSSCFTTRRVHIGMDETHDLGTGKSLDKNGYHERSELYLKHLSRVAAMAEERGLKPMMWSDMFFRLSGKGLQNYADYDPRVELLPEIKELMPKNVTPVFWDYYHPNEDFYTVNIRKHKTLAERTVFAGGVWAWSGHVLHFTRTRDNTVPALEACRKEGIDEVIATVWHNGSEASLTLGLAGIQLYAEYMYKGIYDHSVVSDGFARTCGASLDDILLTEEAEYPHGEKKYSGASRALLYNDPLCGMVDRHLRGLALRPFYEALTPRLYEAAKRNPVFEKEIEIIARLSDLLENKADFGVRLKAAYDAHDTAALVNLKEECALMRQKVEALRKTHRDSWMTLNKPFGWEVFDIRYGGLAARFTTAEERIGDFLAGRIDRIEELEEPRLRIDGSSDQDQPFSGWSVWWGYLSMVTPNIL